MDREGPVATIACLAVEGYKKRGTEELKLRKGSRRDVRGSLGGRGKEVRSAVAGSLPSTSCW